MEPRTPSRFAVGKVQAVGLVRHVGEAGALDPRILPLLPPDDAPASESLPVSEFRANILDIVLSVAGAPLPVHTVRDALVPGPAGEISVRVYAHEGSAPAPVLVYFHGGGWVVLGLDSHDSVCRSLATKANCTVVSVDYRMAPEDPFPAAADDCYAVTKWVSDELGATHIAVAGDSAGGNLAAVTALMARDRDGPSIDHQLLIYPVTNVATFETASYAAYASGYGLTASLMRWFGAQYAPSSGQASDPYVSPLLAASHDGLPPATVITAEFDVLRDEGEAYAARLTDAGVPTECIRYNGVHHGFFIMDGVLTQAVAAQDDAAGALRAAFSQ
jgi:acetyl esterase